MNEQAATVQNQVVKVVTVWGAIGITSWTDAAAAIAFLYSLVLLLEWFWKKVFRPMGISRGWLKPLPKREAAEDE